MKVTITYEYDPSYGLAYWAKANGVAKCGSSYAMARAELLRVLTTKPPEPVPPDEEVEI